MAIRGSTRSSVCAPCPTLIETLRAGTVEAARPERLRRLRAALRRVHFRLRLRGVDRGLLEHARAHGLRGRRCSTSPAGRGTASSRSCGTASACRLRCVGGMLAEAARRAPAGPARARRPARVPDARGFDLVTCFDDSLNYLARDADLAAAFTSIDGICASGGLALFDLNSLQAYRTTFASHALSERDGIVFAWRGASTPGRGARMRRRGDDRRLRPRPGRPLQPCDDAARAAALPARARGRAAGRAGLECSPSMACSTTARSSSPLPRPST